MSICQERVYQDIKPFQKGLNKILGNLETDVMEIVWANGKVSGRDVYLQLSNEREIAYTTVMTTLNRLVEKSILKKQRGSKRYIYSAMLPKQEFINKMVANIFDGLVEDYEDVVLAYFIRNYLNCTTKTRNPLKL